MAHIHFAAATGFPALIYSHILEAKWLRHLLIPKLAIIKLIKSIQISLSWQPREIARPTVGGQVRCGWPEAFKRSALDCVNKPRNEKPGTAKLGVQGG